MNQKKQHENELGENELVSWFDDKLGHLKPYWTQIALGACLLLLAGLAVAFIWDRAAAAESLKWQQLAIAKGNYQRTLDNTSLSDTASEYPDDPAGMWALLYSADAEIRAGLADLGSDRTAGFDKIAKAQKFYRQIVDSNVTKSTMLQRRSVFGLAYALESGGEFEEAAKYYQQLVDLGEDSPFYDDSMRGVERSTDPTYAALFEKFKTYEQVPDEAPGMKLPQRPDISFPESNAAPMQSGGGEFSGESAPDESAAAPDEQTGDGESATEDDNSTEAPD